MQRLVFTFFILVSFSLQAKEQTKECDFKEIKLRYAKMFKLFKSHSMYKLQFDQQPPLFLYKGRRVHCGKGGYVKYPLRKMALFSTTYIGFLERLKSIKSMRYVQTLDYIYSKRVKELFNQKKIIELGYPVSSELIAKYRPQIIIDFPPVGVLPTYIYSASRLRIPTLFIKEHMELHPLARAEWIKVFGVLIDKFDKAVVEFNKSVSLYEKIKNNVPKGKNYKALIGKMYSGAWNAPAKKSYLVQFLKDINVSYLFSERDEGRLTLSFEEVLKLQSQATHWLPQALWQQISDADREDRRYKLISKELRANCFSNSRRLSKQGSDYWESGVAYPEKIITDLAKAFYPENFKKTKFYYYRKL